MSDDSLPTGKTCADCRNFHHCKWLVSRKGDETECDWIPSKFAALATLSPPATERTEG